MVEPEPLWGGHPRDPGLLSALVLVRGALAWNMRRLRERLSAPLALRCALVPADQRAVSERVTTAIRAAQDGRRVAIVDEPGLSQPSRHDSEKP